jgi:hypothetical protein
MARQSPADKLVRLERAIRAWEARRPHAVYHGFTLSKFKAAVQPSLGHSQGDQRAEGRRIN